MSKNVKGRTPNPKIFGPHPKKISKILFLGICKCNRTVTFKRSSKVTQGHERSKIDIFPKIQGKLSGTVEFYICLFSKCGGRILGGWAGKFSRQAVNLHQGNSILLIQPTGVWYCTFCMQNCHFIYFLLFFVIFLLFVII